MVIYDVPAPRHWKFEDYNGDPGKMDAYIAETDAQARRVPYKENRWVLFDSTLLHTTDRFASNLVTATGGSTPRCFTAGSWVRTEPFWPE